jgi:hypothetical protein
MSPLFFLSFQTPVKRILRCGTGSALLEFKESGVNFSFLTDLGKSVSLLPIISIFPMLPEVMLIQQELVYFG